MKNMRSLLSKRWLRGFEEERSLKKKLGAWKVEEQTWLLWRWELEKENMKGWRICEVLFIQDRSASLFIELTSKWDFRFWSYSRGSCLITLMVALSWAQKDSPSLFCNNFMSRNCNFATNL